MTDLPRMQRLAPIVDPDGKPSMSFHIWWDKFATQIESNITDLFAALSSMPDIPDAHVTADYTGTINTGQLPLNIVATRLTNTTDDSANATWAFTTDNSGITATITDGVLNVTAITATTQVTITSTYQGVDKSRTFTIYLDVAAPPATGTGGGGSSSDTTFSSFNSTSHAPVSDEITVTVGSSGNVTLSAPLTVSTDSGTPHGSFQIFAKWQWWNGAAWADVGTEVSSNPNCLTKLKSGAEVVINGNVSVPQTKTGLGVGTSQKFRLEARNNSGTRVMYLSGTASAVSN